MALPVEVEELPKKADAPVRRCVAAALRRCFLRLSLAFF